MNPSESREDDISNEQTIVMKKLTSPDSLKLQESQAIPTFSQCIVRTEINQRENNEDSFHIYDLHVVGGQPPVQMLAIADGMGGHAYGEHVSREALRKVSLALFEQLCVDPAINRLGETQAVDVESISRVLWNAVEQTNSYVRRMVQNNKWGKAGSTIVVVAILDQKAIVVNLGDSPLFHYHASTGQLQKITDDHTVAGTLLRAGMITPEMALYHEGRSRLEFFIGAEALPRKIPIHYIELAPDDLLFLCSDGVTGLLEHKQVEEIVGEPNRSLEMIANRLFEAALNKGETDNQTAILWRQGKLQARNALERDVSTQTPSTDMGESDVYLQTANVDSGEHVDKQGYETEK